MDKTGLISAIDRSVAESSSAGSLVSFKSDVTEIWDERLGMNFVVRIAKNLVSKEASDGQQKVIPRAPFQAPFEPGLFVKDLDDSHRLLLNKFNVVDRHVLVVTTEFSPQNSPMSTATLTQVMSCIEKMHGLAFHNHGVDSGASQPHFHIQVIPRQESDRIPDAPISSVMLQFPHLFNVPGTIPRFPFLHLAVRFTDFTVAAVERHYRAMLMQLNLTTGSSYSFLLTSEYMLVGDD